MKTIFLSAVLLVVGCVCVVVAQDSTSHSSHDHHSSHDEEGGHGFEEAAVYNMNMGTHNIIAVAAGESFEEESLAFMIVPTSAADPDGLEEAEEVSEAGKIQLYLDKESSSICDNLLLYRLLRFSSAAIVRVQKKTRTTRWNGYIPSHPAVTSVAFTHDLLLIAEVVRVCVSKHSYAQIDSVVQHKKSVR